MRNVKIGLIVVALLLLATVSSVVAQGISLPPPEAAWNNNRLMREDPRPLEIGELVNRPVTDGMIHATEWLGATTFEVRNNAGDVLGTLYAGVYNGTVFMGNDWTVNTDPERANGAANAWRFGTAIGPGPQNSGTGNWYEVYVDGTSGTTTGMARWATSEDGLQNSGFEEAQSFFDIFTELSFNGNNWQYELEVDRNPTVDQVNPMSAFPDPGPLPKCWHWEWRQIDPLPWDGVWEPVFDGTIHTPEPSTVISLVGMVVMGMLYLWRRRS